MPAATTTTTASEPQLPLLQEILASAASPVILELGANDGYHTRLLLSMCRRPAVLCAFEPDPRNVRLFEATGLQHSVYFFPHAVGHVTGKVTLNLATPEPGGAIGASSISGFTPVLSEAWPWLRCAGSVEVDCWRLDDFIRHAALDRVDLIWMDVQGAERLVFAGAQETLRRTRYIFTEFDSGALYEHSSSLADIRAMLPGWEVVMQLPGDVLLRNTEVAGGGTG